MKNLSEFQNVFLTGVELGFESVALLDESNPFASLRERWACWDEEQYTGHLLQ